MYFLKPTFAAPSDSAAPGQMINPECPNGCYAAVYNCFHGCWLETHLTVFSIFKNWCYTKWKFSTGIFRR